MASLSYTAQAEADLTDVWLYIAQDNPEAADRQLDRIEEACLRLAAFPQLGAARPDIAEGLRYFVVGSYLIFYRIVDAGAEIVRVVFGSRDLARLL
jgi:toxin ParE1/3/4